MKESFHLPSGVRITFAPAAARPAAAHWAEELANVELRVVGRDGTERPLAALPLADYHAARALARRLGRLEDALAELVCANCDARWAVRPASTLELGPYRDGELDDPELDTTLPFLEPCSIGPDDVHRARFEATTLERAAALARPGSPLRLDSAFVRALGLVELDGDRDARRIARKLQRLSGDDFDALADSYEAHHYARRLEAPHPCPSCDAVEWVALPIQRELGRVLSVGRGEAKDFPDADQFERLVGEIVRERWGDRGPRDVAVEVIAGPAHCDDEGVALLGSYTPPDPDGVAGPGVIRLYHRTFQDEHALEPFDVRAEIAETLRHELEHHVGYLEGADPLDDGERAALADAEVRRVGRSAARRRAARALGRDARGFWRATWPVWAVVLLATAASVWFER
ncbi:MAG: metallopeptidase family protein [Polyangiaceae bacterium]|nr:metallopeptidase family protein [Polyangiaceae bacterium]